MRQIAEISGLSRQSLVAPELQHEIEQFLFAEAALLDERRFDEWYALLAEDLHYYMPAQTNLGRSQAELGELHQAAYFDDDKEYIGLRIKRLHTGRAWAEEPSSRTRHLVSNVRLMLLQVDGEVEANSIFYVYRSRLERQLDQFVGQRTDVLRRADNMYGWQIARRSIYLDQATLLSGNLSIFF